MLTLFQYKETLQPYGDLNDMLSGNARVVMRRFDYVKMIKGLTNQSATLFGKPPEEIIGIPVTFNDKAVIPVVGDFRYAQRQCSA